MKKFPPNMTRLIAARRASIRRDRKLRQAAEKTEEAEEEAASTPTPAEPRLSHGLRGSPPRQPARDKTTPRPTVDLGPMHARQRKKEQIGRRTDTPPSHEPELPPPPQVERVEGWHKMIGVPENYEPSKKRKNVVGISVSEEEAFILKAHAAALKLSFSAWARSVLFHAAGKQIPPRTAPSLENGTVTSTQHRGKSRKKNP
jgi:hypothetical protein